MVAEMDALNAISNVGFPIAAYLLLFYHIGGKLDKIADKLDAIKAVQK